LPVFLSTAQNSARPCKCRAHVYKCENASGRQSDHGGM
jgi:hypothetical protein